MRVDQTKSRVLSDKTTKLHSVRLIFASLKIICRKQNAQVEGTLLPFCRKKSPFVIYEKKRKEKTVYKCGRWPSKCCQQVVSHAEAPSSSASELKRQIWFENALNLVCARNFLVFKELRPKVLNKLNKTSLCRARCNFLHKIRCSFEMLILCHLIFSSFSVYM